MRYELTSEYIAMLETFEPIITKLRDRHFKTVQQLEATENISSYLDALEASQKILLQTTSMLEASEAFNALVVGTVGKKINEYWKTHYLLRRIDTQVYNLAFGEMDNLSNWKYEYSRLGKFYDATLEAIKTALRQSYED